MTNYPDIELHKHLQRLAEDDAGAMSFLYIRYAGKIKGLALRLLGNMEDARDVAQDVFMHLWELRRQLADVESLDAFIFRMAHNATINRLQHRVVVQRFEQQRKKEAVETVEPVSTAELERRIDEAIAQLPDLRQRIFTMSRVDHMTHAQIAAELNISQRTVHYHISSALSFLRKRLGDAMLLALIGLESFT